MADLQALWSRLSPQARTAVTVAGAGAAGLLVLRSRSSSAADTPAPDPVDSSTNVDTGAGGLPIGSTDAIGVDQLAAYESSVAETLSTLVNAVDDLTNKSNATSTPTTRGWKRDVIRKGESANTAASRVRKATPRTRDGQPLTGAYIVHANHWKGTPTQRRWTGTPFMY